MCLLVVVFCLLVVVCCLRVGCWLLCVGCCLFVCAGFKLVFVVCCLFVVGLAGFRGVCWWVHCLLLFVCNGVLAVCLCWSACCLCCLLVGLLVVC